MTAMLEYVMDCLLTNRYKYLFFINSGNHDIVLKTNRSTRFKELYEGAKFNLLLRDEDARQTFIKGKCRNITIDIVVLQIYFRWLLFNTLSIIWTELSPRKVVFTICCTQFSNVSTGICRIFRCK